MLHPSTDLIADAQHFYALDPSARNLGRVLRALSNLLQEEANILLPVSAAAQAAGQLALVTHEAEDGQTYFAIYSSAGQIASEHADEYEILARPLSNFLEVIVQMDGIAGLVFNPDSPSPLAVQKKMLAEILKHQRQKPQKNALNVLKGDITLLECDAIVNAANSTLLGGGGVDGAIHAAAGAELVAECAQLQGCATGEAKLTFGYQLPATYVIHTVGPIYNGAIAQRLDLANCYQKSLDLAAEHHLHSIAFSAISTGVYAYPLEEAARIALLTCTEWLNAHPAYGMEITLVAFNNAVLQSYMELIEAAKRGELE